MSEPTVEIVMDESGNSGEDLLNQQQPVYALAGVLVPADQARDAVKKALSRTQMPELKFARLRSSGPGRRNVLDLLTGLGLTKDTAAVWVAHKPTMLALKLVDELVAPRMLKRGVQKIWYDTGQARQMAFAFAQRAPGALGGAYPALTASFAALVRGYSSETAQAFIASLQAARDGCSDPEVAETLSLMIDTNAELRDAFDGYRDNLEPALPALFWQGSHWTKKLQHPFAVVHDESDTVRRWEETFARMLDYAEQLRQRDASHRPRTLAVGNQEATLPDLMTQLRFAQSHNDPRLQVADVLAGAAAHLYETLTGLRKPDKFARELVRAGVVDLFSDGVGPDADQQAVDFLRR